jgi:glycerol-3-phosphate dehydrogenase (NAD(P)+)
MELKVSVLGAGSWGTTVAALVARNAPTLLWARNPEVAREIHEERRNHRYLGDAALSPRLRATADLAEAVTDADVLVLGVPAQTVRQTLVDVRPHLRPWVPVISLSKGLEQGTRSRMTQIIREELPGHPPGVLTGPNLAREIVGGMAAASVVAMEDDAIIHHVQGLFSSGLFRVYRNTDVIGCELAGALKNVIAIAVGMGDGLGAGDNTRAGVITRGLAELTRLGVALGGREGTFAGLAGMGDLVATCTSPQSRNRYVGEQLGRGRSLDAVIEEMHMVAEGVKTVPVVVQMAEELGLDLPIAAGVHRVVLGEWNPNQAFRGLLRTEHGDEADPG